MFLLVIVLGIILVFVAWIGFRQPDVPWPPLFGRWPQPWRAEDHLTSPGLTIYWIGFVLAIGGAVLNLFSILGGA